MTDANPRVLAIGLDAGEPMWIERWIRDGAMPNLTRIARAGSSTQLLSNGGIFPDAPWPTFSTGSGPGFHGYYFYQQVAPGSGRMTMMQNRAHRRPFWSLVAKAGKPAVIFDVPKVALQDDDELVQIINWGEKFGALHASRPRGLLADVRRRFGRAPITTEARSLRGEAHARRLLHRLAQGAERRTAIAQYLMAHAPWELFVVVFSESHSGGHQFYPHQIGRFRRGRATVEAKNEDRIRQVYQHIDAALGELVAAAGADTDVFVFSAHGMAARSDSHGVLRPFLQRLGLLAPPAPTDGRDPIKQLRGLLPLQLRDSINQVLPKQIQESLVARYLAGSYDWTRTRAYLEDTTQENLPWIRINLRGREPLGTVQPGAEYDQLCDEITHELRELRIYPSGEPAVADVVRVREAFAGPHTAELPDLVVQWTPGRWFRTVAHPRLGIIIGESRTGQVTSHASRAFLAASGPRIGASANPIGAHVVDLAPTILHLLDAPIPSDMEGRVLSELLGPDFNAQHPIRTSSIDWSSPLWDGA